jgi:glycerol uptake facilitator protein
MSPILAEVFGTALLIVLGDGVVAGVLLNKSKAQNSGWIVIATGWGLGVALAVYAVSSVSGGHINPAVTLALAAIGKFSWSLVPGYIAAQVAGAAVGSAVVWLAYLPHWKETSDPAAKLAVFCTSPAIRTNSGNFICEAIGTFVLVMGSLAIASPANLLPNSGFDKGFGPALAGLLVWGIGLSLGGPTGYAINPERPCLLIAACRGAGPSTFASKFTTMA